MFSMLKHEMFDPFVEIDSCKNIVQINTESRYGQNQFIEMRGEKKRLLTIMHNE